MAERRVHPHIFRKAFATAFLDGGGDAERHYADVFGLVWRGRRGATGASAPGIGRAGLLRLPRPCAFTSAALVGDTIYVAGGQQTPDAMDSS